METAALIIVTILTILLNVSIIVIGYTTSELNRLRNEYVKVVDKYVDTLIKLDTLNKKENNENE